MGTLLKWVRLAKLAKLKMNKMSFNDRLLMYFDKKERFK